MRSIEAYTEDSIVHKRDCNEAAADLKEANDLECAVYIDVARMRSEFLKRVMKDSEVPVHMAWSQIRDVALKEVREARNALTDAENMIKRLQEQVSWLSQK